MLPCSGSVPRGVAPWLGPAPLLAQERRADSTKTPGADSLKRTPADSGPRATPDSTARAAFADDSAGQELIYGGRYEAAAQYFADLSRRYPGDPAGPALAASNLIWWGEARDDDAFEEDSIDALLTDAANLARRAAAGAASDAEHVRALFWAGTALGYRARQADLHGHPWKAVGDAKRMRAALDTALALDSGCVDCRLGLAVYEYALARAWVLTRLVAQLLGLGGGNAARAIDAMRQVSERGTVTRLEGRWLLASALLREGGPGDPRREEARGIIADLAARFPDNPVFRRFADSGAAAP